MPLFSVVIPTHNRAPLLPRSMTSLQRQSLPDFEAIIVDDGSTDNTESVVHGLKDARFRYIRLDRNQGASNARNVGVAHAEGLLISLLDSDDEYAHDFLEQTAAALSETNEEVGFSWTGRTYLCFDEPHPGHKRRRLVEAIWTPPFSSREEALAYCLTHDAPWGTGHGVTLKRGVLETVGGFDTSLHAREDEDIFIRLVREFDYVVIPRLLVTIHNDAPHRVDGNALNRARAYDHMYAKYSDLIHPHEESRRFFVRMILNGYRDARQPGLALRWFIGQLHGPARNSVLYREFLHYLGREFIRYLART